MDRSFFLRIQAKKGTNIAAVALARKVLCIVHHLLIMQEMYEEDEHDNDDETESLENSGKMCLDDMIRYVVNAGYEVRKRNTVGG